MKNKYRVSSFCGYFQIQQKVWWWPFWFDICGLQQTKRAAEDVILMRARIYTP